MKKILWVLTLILIVLHQDLWNWAKDAPLIGAFLPIGLWYHAIFCIAASALLALFVAFAWPKELENAEPETPEAREAEGYAER